MPTYDLNTLLSKFLNDLYAGILGTTLPITAVRTGDGTAGAPPWSFLSEPTLGFRRSGTSTVGYGANTTAITFNGVTGTIALATDSATLVFGGSADLTMSRGAAGVITPAANQSYGFGSAPLFTRTAPTVTSAGTSPSITASNGTAAFVVNVGTGGVATTIVLAMPAATTGWMAFVENVTATAANRANQRVVVQSSTTTSLTLQNQTISTGAALAFTASDIVRVIATAY